VSWICCIEDEISHRQSRTILPILAFSLVSIFSFFWAILMVSICKECTCHAQLGGGDQSTLCNCLLLLVAHLVDNLRKLEYLTWTFIIGSYICHTIVINMVDCRSCRGFTAGSLFWTWMASFIIWSDNSKRDLKFNIRFLLILVLTMTFYVAIVKSYDWRSGWFPPLIGFLVIITIRY
jgi:hypothetical protein